MAMLAEAAPGHHFTRLPVFATKTCVSPFASPARWAHRRTVLLSTSITDVETHTVGATCMTARTLANVVGHGEAIKAARRRPTTPLGIAWTPLFY